MRVCWIVVAAACGSSAPRLQPELANRSEAPPAVGPVCPASLPDLDTDGFAGIVFDGPATAALRCESGRVNCRVQLVITITNCRPAEVVAWALDWHLDGPTIAVPDGTFPHTLAPGESWSFTATANGEGQVAIPISMMSPSVPRSLVTTLGPPAVRVTNPARDEDLRACRVCNGDWGHHGMMWTIDPSPGADPGDSCRCRSTDAGTACRDGDECQGWCETTGFVVEGHQGGTGLPIGHAIGACSEFTGQGGCMHPIAHGAAKLPPAPQVLNEICID